MTEPDGKISSDERKALREEMAGHNYVSGGSCTCGKKLKDCFPEFETHLDEVAYMFGKRAQ